MSLTPFDFATESFPLAPATYYNVGGPARVALHPRSREEAASAYAWMLDRPEPGLVLGRGSNVLIADEGFPGIVLFTTRIGGISDLGGGRYAIDSGVDLDRVVRGTLLERNYAGVGGLTGIPGSVGGAIFMNAGTVNGSTCEWLETVDVLGAGGPRTVAVTPDLYDYREQHLCAPEELILGGTFRFREAENDQRAVYEHYMRRRREKQPQGRCCGSVFKNPPGDHAGRLVEACGLKGTRRGGAIVSSLHANFIMNEGGATCGDILALIDLCKCSVREKFGIELDEEVRIVPRR